MKRALTILVCALALVATACGASGDDEGAEEEGGTETTQATAGGGVGDFGDLEGICGPAPDGVEVTIEDGEAGRGDDKLYLGVANDRTSQIRQGLLKEMWDASQAFAGWCNEAGGIAGKQIELVDLDGQVTQVEAAMTTACTDVFAMVGGGFAFDTQIFSGKDGSDFHRCGLIAIPGFAVSTDFADANGQQQALPNPGYTKPNTWFRDLVSLDPEAMADVAVVYGELPSIKINKEQLVATGDTVEGVNWNSEIAYSLVNPNFDVTVQQIQDSEAKAVAFIGEPDNLSTLMSKLRQQDFEGLVFAETNHYDPQVFSAGAGSAEGLVIRTAFHPFEEADMWPATKQMLEILDEFGPADPKIAGLSIQSFSSWLLFANAVNTCVADNDGVISRDCVLGAASDVEEWTGGGLHATTFPSEDEGPVCNVLLRATADDTWERFHPEIDSDDDAGNGFSCYDDGNVEITGDLGEGNVDPDRGD